MRFTLVSATLVTSLLVACGDDGDDGAALTPDDGSALDRGQPVDVVGLGDAAAIAGGENHTCAVRTNGQIACWGSNAYAQLGNEGGDVAAPVLVAFPDLP